VKQKKLVGAAALTPAKRSPRGATVSDADVYNALAPHTRLCKRHSGRTDKAFRGLQCTAKDAYRATPELKRRASLSSVYRKLRLHSPRLGITRFVQRTDLCRVCHTFDKMVVPDVKGWLEEVRTTMKEFDSEYWSASNLQWDSLITIELLRQLMRYLDSRGPPSDEMLHVAVHQEAKDQLDENDHPEPAHVAFQAARLHEEVHSGLYDRPSGGRLVRPFGLGGARGSILK